MGPGRGGEDDISQAAFVGLAEPAREFLLQVLLYKSVFLGDSFRLLAEREADEELRERLLCISRESAAEAAGLVVLVHEWDKHPGVWDRVNVTIEETRGRLLRDLIQLKEGMTETGLAAAMRAPTAELRARFLKLVDLDRRHADQLRDFLGATTTDAFRATHGHGLGAHDAHGRRSSLGAAMRLRLSQLQSKGVRPRRVVVSPDALRHLRDEADLSEEGRWMGLAIEIDAGWEGDVFAIETDERLAYAELLVAEKTSAPGPEDDF